MRALQVAIALCLSLASTLILNLAYLREHGAAAALPPLRLRQPLASLRLLLADRRWLGGFALETTGFGLYVAALALAPLALVQSVGAGGIGVLALASARFERRRMTRREGWGAAIAVVGLACLAVSLSGGVGGGGRGGAIAPILAWLAGSVVAAVVVRGVAAGRGDRGVSYGIAGGLLFAVGDISTKLATQGGARVAFALPLVGGYLIGTALLQVGYQRGGALTIAGIATLLANALPIAAGTVLLGEPVPGGVLGALRIAAFAIVVVGAIVLGRPETPRER